MRVLIDLNCAAVKSFVWWNERSSTYSDMLSRASIMHVEGVGPELTADDVVRGALFWQTPKWI